MLLSLVPDPLSTFTSIACGLSTVCTVGGDQIHTNSPSGAFSPQRELDSQHYILHLKQDQLNHTLKNKGTEVALLENVDLGYLATTQKSLQQPKTIAMFPSPCFYAHFEVEKKSFYAHLRWILICAKKA